MDAAFDVTCQPALRGQILLDSDRDGTSLLIYLMNEDGSDPRRISHDSWNDVYPKASPDGTRIAFQSDRRGFFSIYVMNIDGSGATALLPDSMAGALPSWSPDGSKIVFDRSHIFRVNADGTGLVQLTPGNNNITDNGASWSRQ